MANPESRQAGIFSETGFRVRHSASKTRVNAPMRAPRNDSGELRLQPYRASSSGIITTTSTSIRKSRCDSLRTSTVALARKVVAAVRHMLAKQASPPLPAVPQS
jgi:hypothetical protein